jgi:hypothetical protein
MRVGFASCQAARGSKCLRLCHALCQNQRDSAAPSGPRRDSAARKHLKGLQCVDNFEFRTPLPYFHNGFAADLDAVVDFYNSRFDIKLTKQEKSDLVAFLRAL